MELGSFLPIFAAGASWIRSSISPPQLTVGGRENLGPGRSIGYVHFNAQKDAREKSLALSTYGYGQSNWHPLLAQPFVTHRLSNVEFDSFDLE